MSPGNPPLSLTSLDLVGESSPPDLDTIPPQIVRATNPGSSYVAESYPVDFPMLIGPGLGMFGGDQGGDPILAGRYGGYWPADRVQLPNHAPLGFITEFQYRAAISWARWLLERNHLAIGFREHVSNFIGPMQVQFVRRDQRPGEQANDDPEEIAAQRVWDEWCELADWGQGEEDREKESRDRLLRDGETRMRLGAGNRKSEFLPWVRFIEPEQIRLPVGNVRTDGNWSWGICTRRGDAEDVLAYWIADQDSGGGSGEEVDACDVIAMKANVDRTIKRGLPDFFPIEQPLQEALGILANMGATTREQSSVAWIEQYATATLDQARNMLLAGKESYAPPGAEVRSRSAPMNRFTQKTYGQTRVIHADNNRQFGPGPVSEGVPSYTQVVDATLKGVGFRFSIPDWFSTGSADSFAGALVTGSPFVRSTQARQDKQKAFTKRLAMRVIEIAEKSGRLRPGTSRKVKPVVTAQPIVIADEQKQASVTEMELRNKLIDPQEAIKKRGRDPKVVIANWKAWEKEFSGKAPTPQANPLPGGKAPTPAPPGSAGGDGSEGIDDLFRVSESAGPHTFASTHVALYGEAGSAILSLGRAVLDQDLAEGGRELDPHVTVLHGLETDKAADVAPLLMRQRPIRLRLGPVSVFPATDERPSDVLMVEVDSPDLVRLHEILATLPHTDLQPVYRPHATIAYLKPGMGEKYAKRFAPLDLNATVTDVIFSNRAGQWVSLPLSAAELAPNLVEKDVQVHRGGKTFTQHRKVRAGEDAHGEHEHNQGGIGAESKAPRLDEHEKIDLGEIAASPEVKADPSLLGKIKEKAATAFHKAVALLTNPQAALYTIAYHTPQILGLYGDIFDEPKDFAKIGYNPSGGHVSGEHHTTLDPVKANLGIPAHMAMGLAFKVGFAVVAAVKKKLGGSSVTEAAIDFDQAGTFLNGLLGAIAEELGLPAPPSAEEIAGHLRKLMSKGD